MKSLPTLQLDKTLNKIQILKDRLIEIFLNLLNSVVLKTEYTGLELELMGI